MATRSGTRSLPALALAALAASVLGGAAPARAMQHLFHVNEIFTSADGSVQFIELLGEAEQQGAFMGMFLCSGDTAITPGQPGRQCFQFTMNLNSTETQGKSLLFASRGYMALAAAQKLPMPDFILEGPAIDPSKPFFNVKGDEIDFLPQDTRTAEVIFPAFPTDGKMSFNGPFTTRSNANMTRPMDLGMRANSPMNFAGQSGQVDATRRPGVGAPAARADTADRDRDGVPDSLDMCPTVADPDQRDTDGDRVGDACDSCVQVSNPRVSLSPGQSSTGGQIDDDADGFGNECDADFMQGGRVDARDLALMTAAMGRPVFSNTCGASGRESCARFDLFPGAKLIDADDLRVFRSLLDQPAGPKCDLCPLQECAGPACTNDSPR